MKCVKRWGEIKRLGIAGFVTETGDCCLDLADEISKYWGYIDLASIGKIFSSLYSDSILTRFQFCRWGFSWHHWAYKLYGDWTWDSHGLWNLGDDDNYDCPTVESCLNWERAKYFARVFPEALNGQGESLDFYDFSGKETSSASHKSSRVHVHCNECMVHMTV